MEFTEHIEMEKRKIKRIKIGAPVEVRKTNYVSALRKLN